MTDGQRGSSTVPDQDVFVAEFRRWRDVRGLSRSARARQMGYSRSYVSKIESGSEHASRDFATTADTTLNAGGAIRRAWRDQEAANRPAAGRAPGLIAPGAGAEPLGSLLVEHDHAELRYDGGTYWATMRRKLVNNGEYPITRYLIRVSVDRFPGDPERSNQLYRDNPLTWQEIGLQAWCGEYRAEPMRWTVQHDRDAFKEVWLEWHFRDAEHANPEASPKPSETMSALGIVQEGDLVLRRPARLFSLPAEAEDARRVISELHSATQRVATVHTFGKGMGIAAPQIGIERAAAIVRPRDTDDVLTLLNPRIIDTGDETDEQYEGCLSFFDVRCLVNRPLVIHVEHQDINGERRITIFERGIARLVAHEIDHLNGILCRDHLPADLPPIPVEQYRGTGTGWQYHENGAIR